MKGVSRAVAHVECSVNHDQSNNHLELELSILVNLSVSRMSSDTLDKIEKDVERCLSEHLASAVDVDCTWYDDEFDEIESCVKEKGSFADSCREPSATSTAWFLVRYESALIFWFSNGYLMCVKPEKGAKQLVEQFKKEGHDVLEHVRARQDLPASPPNLSSVERSFVEVSRPLMLWIHSGLRFQLRTTKQLEQLILGNKRLIQSVFAGDGKSDHEPEIYSFGYDGAVTLEDILEDSPLSSRLVLSASEEVPSSVLSYVKMQHRLLMPPSVYRTYPRLLQLEQYKIDISNALLKNPLRTEVLRNRVAEGEKRIGELRLYVQKKVDSLVALKHQLSNEFAAAELFCMSWDRNLRAGHTQVRLPQDRMRLVLEILEDTYRGRISHIELLDEQLRRLSDMLGERRLSNTLFMSSVFSLVSIPILVAIARLVGYDWVASIALSAVVALIVSGIYSIPNLRR